MAKYPEPTVPEPTDEELLDMLQDAVLDRAISFETSDGCTTDPDGTCQHGHPTWLVRYALI